MPDPASLALREHFVTPEQQRQTSAIGMWIFLASEVMMFGALFTGYTVYRVSHPQAFAEGSAHMEIWLGSINTAVLLTSSLTVALAEHSAQLGRRGLLALFLVLTVLIGCLFLGIKFTEYIDHFHQHEAPGVWFNFARGETPPVEMFFVYYFIMTGLHSIHMIVGIFILLWLLYRTWLGSFTAIYHTPVFMGGLYWHFVDIIWIFLYAIFYLPGLHK